MITEILIQPPPFLDKIIAAGMDPDLRYTVFTHGTILYNPGGGDIPGHLMAHENTHVDQQGEDPNEWWNRYLSDIPFRLSQETEAYHNQYVYYCRLYKGKNDQFNFLRMLGGYLASPMYGGIVGLSEAMQLIKNFNK